MSVAAPKRIAEEDRRRATGQVGEDSRAEGSQATETAESTEGACRLSP